MNMGDLRSAVAAKKVLEIGRIIETIEDVPKDVAFDYVNSALGYVPPSRWLYFAPYEEEGKCLIGSFYDAYMTSDIEKHVEAIIDIDGRREICFRFESIWWEAHKTTIGLRSIMLQALKGSLELKGSSPRLDALYEVSQNVILAKCVGDLKSAIKNSQWISKEEEETHPIVSFIRTIEPLNFVSMARLVKPGTNILLDQKKLVEEAIIMQTQVNMEIK